MKVILTKSKRAAKKYAVRVGNKTIHFGAQGYEDFTTHKDPKRKANYVARHRHEKLERPNNRWSLGQTPIVEQRHARGSNTRYAKKRI